MNIYVGNIDSIVKENEIHELFSSFGQVSKVTIVRDRHGISKGFGFVEMPSQLEADSAINGLNRMVFRDRTLDVSESSPKGAKIGRDKKKPRRVRFRK